MLDSMPHAQGTTSMISSLPGLNSSKLDSVMESLQRQRMMEQQAQLHQAMQVLQNGKARCSPDQTAQERLSHDSSNEDDKENKDDEIEEFSTDNKLPVPNFSMPNFPPGFAANLPHNLPNFDPSNLPQGVRELAMLQHQQMAQRSVQAIAAEAQKRLHMQNSQNSSFNSSKGRSPGDRSSPSTPSDSARGVVAPTGDGAPSGADSNNQQDWTFEEQFKQLYEIDNEPGRKEFLDEIFTFMQKRGTPVSRIPIMAKQVLDLFRLYKLVVERGGLVEVINKKIWREITKGLSLPSSITSAAFTLRTQYMKYLYPYECEKEKLSSPAELQAAIDGNRREGRRPSYGNPYGFPEGVPGLHPGFPAMPGGQMLPNGLRLPNGGAFTGNVPHIRPEERLMAAQQHQLLQAANAQHMAAMVALEAMQNQAKKNAAQTQASQLALSMGGRGSPVKREHPDLESDSPLPKIMRTMAQSMQNPTAFAAQSPKPVQSEPTRVSSPRSETARSQTPPQIPENRFMSQSPVVSSQPQSQNCSKSRSPVAQIATAAALGRLFPNVNPSMNAKVNVNETDPDDDSNPGSITMAIEVNGVQYEGILFAKIQDEGYLEAKRESLPLDPTSLNMENTTTVTPTEAPTNSENRPSSPAEQSSPQK